MKQKNKLMSALHHFFNNTKKSQQTDLLLLGALLARQNQQMPVLEHIANAEFKVFSQGGDDGIIQYLINKVHIANPTFIEFGVEDYVESNTRFLLKHDNWSGMVIDGAEKNIHYIQSDNIYFQHELKAVKAFITKDNINDIIASQGLQGEIGLLSIDIDGNDYWIWEAIRVVEPVIVIMEYNSVFGIEKPVTVPYQHDFVREKAHYSHLYFGASLKAVCMLAAEKGYAFVGSNSMGNNAYFVKAKHIGALKALTPEEGYVPSKFRESRDVKGYLNFLSGSDRYKCIQGLPVYNVATNQLERL
jgi:hypothetical protein